MPYIPDRYEKQIQIIKSRLNYDGTSRERIRLTLIRYQGDWVSAFFDLRAQNAMMEQSWRSS